MVAWKIAPALAAGNTVVLKPAEFTPLTALCLAEIADEAGLPTGVLNVVTGDGRTGELMVNHPDIDKIAFTGSTEVGRIIRKATAGSGKRLSLDRKSTRLNSSHRTISYAVFCLKKKNTPRKPRSTSSRRTLTAGSVSSNRTSTSACCAISASTLLRPAT